MPDDDIRDRFHQFLAQESNRGLGDIALRRTAALSPFSRAQRDAATNLLDKALRALDDEDEAKARRFVERAVALPYDEHEQVHPGAMMAHQWMFNTVTDALDNGGNDWLIAVGGTLAFARDEVRFCLRDVLTAVLQDYDLPGDDERHVRRLIRDIPARAELAELDLPPEEMASAVLDVLVGVIQFVDAYEETVDLADDEE